jgi:hypothetical protein
MTSEFPDPNVQFLGIDELSQAIKRPEPLSEEDLRDESPEDVEHVLWLNGTGQYALTPENRQRGWAHLYRVDPARAEKLRLFLLNNLETALAKAVKKIARLEKKIARTTKEST